MKWLLFSHFSPLILKTLLHYWQEKTTYCRTFSQWENRSALPQGFSVASFIKVSFPFTWYLSYNFKYRAVFSENTVKVCNWVGKLIQQSMVAHGLCLQKAPNPGGAAGVPASALAEEKGVGHPPVPSALGCHRRIFIQALNWIRRLFCLNNTASWFCPPLFFIFLVCFLGGLLMLSPHSCWGAGGGPLGSWGAGTLSWFNH